MPAWETRRSRVVGVVDLGDEPPITMGDHDPARYTRRGVSLRWLFGAVVTAVTSTALMGGALVAALDGRYVVSAEAAALGTAKAQPRAQRSEKGDRMLAVPDGEPPARRTIEVPTVVRQGQDQIIGKRPYVLVNAGLVLDPKRSADVPPFVPNETPPEPTAGGATDAIYGQSVDGEIVVSTQSLPTGDAAVFDDQLDMGDTDIERELRGVTADDAPAGDRTAPAVADEPFVATAGVAVAPNLVVIPENVSELLKSAGDDADAADGSESELVELVQPGDTLEKVLVGSGVPGADIAEIDGVLGRVGVNRLKRGQTLRVKFEVDDEGEGAQRRPSRFSLYEDGAHVATVAMTDEGRFVLGEAPPGPAPEVRDVVVAQDDDQLPSIYRGLYQAMVDQEVPDDVRTLLVQSFGLDLDLNQPARAGDRVTVLYGADDGSGAPAEVLYAALTAGGVERKIYRYKSREGKVDYYDEEGKTGDQFLMRKPVDRAAIFRSGFGMRMHPILRRARLHAGVDYAGPRGTKIYAAGDGVVQIAGWTAGFGRYIQLRHANGYETGYAHQSRLADGITPGVRVRQGQLIGYVGSTGLSTGPHLHYEVRVNGRPVNPLKIRLDRGNELTGATAVAFKAEVEQIDRLIGGEPEKAHR